MQTLSDRATTRLDGVLTETSAERLADWRCHARPARLGRTCGHVNAGPERWFGGVQYAGRASHLGRTPKDALFTTRAADFDKAVERARASLGARP